MRIRAIKMFNHLFVPIDDFSIKISKLKKVQALVKSNGAKLSLSHVSSPFPPIIYAGNGYAAGSYMTLESHREACESHAKRLFERATEILGSELVYSKHHIYESDVTKGIIKGAKKSKADLILMISHRYSGIMGLISSSESQQVIRASELPVLVI